MFTLSVTRQETIQPKIETTRTNIAGAENKDMTLNYKVKGGCEHRPIQSVMQCPVYSKIENQAVNYFSSIMCQPAEKCLSLLKAREGGCGVTKSLLTAGWVIPIT